MSDPTVTDRRAESALGVLSQRLHSVRPGLLGRATKNELRKAIRELFDRADAADRASGIYRVSLDAAIEAAAKAEFERRRGNGEIGRSFPWESESEAKRTFVREYVRPLVTAAVTGGAQ